MTDKTTKNVPVSKIVNKCEFTIKRKAKGFYGNGAMAYALLSALEEVKATSNRSRPMLRLISSVSKKTKDDTPSLLESFDRTMSYRKSKDYIDFWSNASIAALQ